LSFFFSQSFKHIEFVKNIKTDKINQTANKSAVERLDGIFDFKSTTNSQKYFSIS
jgi:hypothetical protein